MSGTNADKNNFMSWNIFGKIDKEFKQIIWYN